ncbi:hypothetical protein M404DRAFT_991241, partial [Pisolithus tinctorius Marx 270]
MENPPFEPSALLLARPEHRENIDFPVDRQGHSISPTLDDVGGAMLSFELFEELYHAVIDGRL